VGSFLLFVCFANRDRSDSAIEFLSTILHLVDASKSVGRDCDFVFRPCWGLCFSPLVFPWLAPWAAFLRRAAAIFGKSGLALWTLFAFLLRLCFC